MRNVVKLKVEKDDWKKSSQTYYRNILREGKQIWQKI